MSMEMASERVCYVQCNFCNTILAVSVPCSSMFTMVTVRCGHCANLLSVNMTAVSSQASPPPELTQHVEEMGSKRISNASGSSSSNSSTITATSFESAEHDPPRTPPIRPPEKKQRVPSAYNKFIKEEIQRIKANNPEITHREAFSLAAKNWAHFPRIHFGLNLEVQKQISKLDQTITGEGAHQKSPGFY
ncbi:hypothetical protein V2J09_006930 [Rumex salicifolius]